MKKVLIIVGASLFALILAVALLVSPIAESYVQNHSKELLGRRITLENLSVNIFRGRVQIDNFVLYEADETTPFVTFRQFDVNVGLFALLRGNIKVEEVNLSNADVHVIQRGDYFNFNDIIDFFSSDSTETEQVTEEQSDLSIVINNIHLDSSSLFYQDQEIGGEWAIKDISITIPGIDLSDLNADMGLELNFLNGGKLHTNIKYDTEKSDYDLQLNIANFQLSPILPYLQQSFDIQSINGKFSTEIHVKGSTDHLMDFDAQGTLQMKDFALQDSFNKNIAACDSIFVGISQIDLINNKVELNKLHAINLSSYYETFADKSDNLSKLFKTDSSAVDSAQIADSVQVVADSSATDESPFSLKIADLQIINAHFDYTDNSLPTAFVYNVSEMCVSAKNFDLNGNNDITASALLHNSGKLKVKWRGSLNDIANQNITIQLNNLDLQPFTPYSLAMFGNPIEGGNMSIQSQNVIFNKMLRGSNKVSIYQPVIGDKNKSIKAEYNIPLKMGIYVLTDKNGKANFDLPISGNIDSPDFSYRKIILKTFGNLLVKVATSPFNAFKSDNGDVNFIQIQPQATEFTDEEYAKFAMLAESQKAKPELRLYLTQNVLYSSAITNYCMLELKKRMAIQDTTNFVNENNADDILIMERYSSIPNKSPELLTFANNSLQIKGLEVDKKQTIEEKAVLLYETEMRTAIIKDMDWRNNLLHNYLTKQCTMPDSVLSISYNLIESDTIPQNTNGYEVIWNIKE